MDIWVEMAGMMQGHLHQLQQQLTSLLAAAAAAAAQPQTPNDAVSSQSALEVAASGRGIDDSARIAAIESLRRAVLYPPNALLLPHCAHFLSQGFSQLLSDKLPLLRIRTHPSTRLDFFLSFFS